MPRLSAIAVAARAKRPGSHLQSRHLIVVSSFDPAVLCKGRQLADALAMSCLKQSTDAHLIAVLHDNAPRASAQKLCFETNRF